MDEVNVSIIVPLYNCEKTIERCLDSLINQTMREIEIVVVNDGSTDNGVKLVEEYQKKDDRIILISQANQGLGAARNTGIKNCRGKYIGFVDADDFVDLRMYQSMYSAICDCQAEIAFCQEKNVYYTAEGKMKQLRESKFPFQEPTVFSGTDVMKWFLNYTYLCLNSACFKLVNKAIFLEKNVWFPEQYRYAEDLTATGGMLCVAQKIVIVPQSLYFYVHQEKTISTSYSVKKAVDVYKDLIDVLSYLEKYEYAGQIDNFILGMSFSSLRQYYADSDEKNRNTSEAKELLSKWKEIKQNRKPVFRNMEVPILHKMKVLVAYLNLEYFFCWTIQKLGKIPFFKFVISSIRILFSDMF